ncbi:hypothetical protein Krad_2290 [Kineococcus radiotolerans SRS30216 = ATCC BAA-149]|uniref:Uncharacterized protein n=1 Tax=Kineococcus radiotolerans (strain ATCC BAA-149 / DSM 14245 / SRS30216) TaxID=266940 RepID=A6WAD2_KINRD|nr:hypothetical protein Krad_2290 [Kineococcus radiotolerans SRS30216 = ATCC BAA-149]
MCRETVDHEGDGSGTPVPGPPGVRECVEAQAGARTPSTMVRKARRRPAGGSDPVARAGREVLGKPPRTLRWKGAGDRADLSPAWAERSGGWPTTITAAVENARRCTGWSTDGGDRVLLVVMTDRVVTGATAVEFTCWARSGSSGRDRAGAGIRRGSELAGGDAGTLPAWTTFRTQPSGGRAPEGGPADGSSSSPSAPPRAGSRTGTQSSEGPVPARASSLGHP